MVCLFYFILFYKPLLVLLFYFRHDLNVIVLYKHLFLDPYSNLPLFQFQRSMSILNHDARRLLLELDRYMSIMGSTSCTSDSSLSVESIAAMFPRQELVRIYLC
jgi:hypothetical protein